MTSFRRLLLASSMAAAMGGLSSPANAIIEGAAGEALLVPFVLFDGNDPNLNAEGVNINTLIEVTVPAQVGIDTVPNFFTAPNSTPTNAGGMFFPPEAALGATGAFSAGLHLYFFDKESNELYNREIPTSPDDFVMINWGDYVTRFATSLNGVAGYVIITNEKSKPDFAPDFWRGPAQFSMMGDAFMVWPVGLGLIDSKIPVLPMSDGASPVGGAPTRVDNVVQQSDGSIANASPLASGMRTNLSDGVDNDFTLFDLTLSNRFAPTLHVIWVDENINQSRVQFVFDDDEKSCSQPLPIKKELNVYWTSPFFLWPANFLTDDQNTNGNFLLGDAGASVELNWVDAALDLCYPDPGSIVFNPGNPGQLFDVLESRILYPGFVRFRIDEYVDNNLGQPESAAVAFSIQLQIDIVNEEGDLLATPQLLPIETALGHERGQFSAN
ncbi:MAG: hypothetical protein WBG92_02385 [Thiohalocapsa sp.]